VTNTAVEYASVSLTKTLDNPGDVGVDGLSYDIEWWLDGEPQSTLTLSAGETVSGERFPVGSILEAAEPRPIDPPGGSWAAPEWTLDGRVLPVQSNGRIAAPVSSRDAGVIAFTLENRLRPDAPAPPTGSGRLPATGGTVPSGPLLTAALMFVLGSALVLSARRRSGEPSP
jgi:hypothetical protein